MPVSEFMLDSGFLQIREKHIVSLLPNWRDMNKNAMGCGLMVRRE